MAVTMSFGFSLPQAEVTRPKHNISVAGWKNRDELLNMEGNVPNTCTSGQLPGDDRGLFPAQRGCDVTYTPDISYEKVQLGWVARLAVTSTLLRADRNRSIVVGYPPG